MRKTRFCTFEQRHRGEFDAIRKVSLIGNCRLL